MIPAPLGQKLSKLLRFILFFFSAGAAYAQQTPIDRIESLDTPYIYNGGSVGYPYRFSEKEALDDSVARLASNQNAYCAVWVGATGSWPPVEEALVGGRVQAGADKTLLAPWLFDRPFTFRLWTNWHSLVAEYRYLGRCLNPQVAIPQLYHYREMYTYCPKGYALTQSQYIVGQAKYFYCQRSLYPIPEWQPPACPSVENPIQAATGNKYQREIDYRAAGVFPLVFERHYSSGSHVMSARLGEKWRHNYDRSIALADTPALSTATAYVYRPDGRIFPFNREAGGSWATNPAFNARLSARHDSGGAPAGWRYIDSDDSTEDYDTSGRLLSIANGAGLTIRLAYDNDRLATVTDTFGRSLVFAYDANGRLVTVTDPAGGIYSYAYGASSNLISVTYPDSRARKYLYENPTFPSALTGIDDENGNRFATYVYDGQGRAISTEHAGGANKATLAYSSTNIYDTTTAVTDALGTVRTYKFQTVLGVSKNTGLSQPCTAGCGASSAATTYDANGNIASRTDFNGVKTTYAYDLTRNLEASRTEASGTPQARTIATQWHPTFRLPATITEPTRRTNFQYDDQGNLLARTETALDTGAARTWRYTYDADGNRLSEDGPREDVSDVTTYDYWPSDATCPGAGEGPGMDKGCRGRLRRTTDAAGHATEYLKYDANGQLLRRRDPNGAEGVYAYDARGRLTARTEAGLATAYRYDPRGLLDQITLPSGAVLNYQYDAAHRLVGVQDNLGNRVSYTLDAAGNRLTETLTDPSGALSRQIAREFDALSRVRRETWGAQP